MAEPTLKDLLDAMSRLETRLESGQREIRADMATKTDLAKVEAKVDAVGADVGAVRAEVAAHRAETAKGFTDLDRELTKHAEVHRELEKDVEAIKRRPIRTAARPARRR